MRGKWQRQCSSPHCLCAGPQGKGTAWSGQRGAVQTEPQRRNVTDAPRARGGAMKLKIAHFPNNPGVTAARMKNRGPSHPSGTPRCVHTVVPQPVVNPQCHAVRLLGISGWHFCGQQSLCMFKAGPRLLVWLGWAGLRRVWRNPPTPQYILGGSRHRGHAKGIQVLADCTTSVPHHKHRFPF